MALSSMGVLHDGGIRQKRGGSSGGRLAVPAKQKHRGPERGSSSDGHGEPAVQAKFRRQCQSDADIHHIDKGQRDQDVPTEAHKLIETKAREREAQPHEEINIDRNLEEKPERSVKAVVHELKRQMTERRGQTENCSSDEACERDGRHEQGLHAGTLLPCAYNAI